MDASISSSDFVPNNIGHNTCLLLVPGKQDTKEPKITKNQEEGNDKIVPIDEIPIRLTIDFKEPTIADVDTDNYFLKPVITKFQSAFKKLKAFLQEAKALTNPNILFIHKQDLFLQVSQQLEEKARKLKAAVMIRMDFKGPTIRIRSLDIVEGTKRIVLDSKQAKITQGFKDIKVNLRLQVSDMHNFKTKINISNRPYRLKDNVFAKDLTMDNYIVVPLENCRDNNIPELAVFIEDGNNVALIFKCAQNNKVVKLVINRDDLRVDWCLCRVTKCQMDDPQCDHCHCFAHNTNEAAHESAVFDFESNLKLPIYHFAIFNFHRIDMHHQNCIDNRVLKVVV